MWEKLDVIQYTGERMLFIVSVYLINFLMVDYEFHQESLDISEASMRHFKIALSRVQPSNVQFYEELAAQFERFVDDGSI